MRLSDPITATKREIVEVCVVSAFMLAIVFIAFGADRPGYAGVILIAGLLSLRAYGRWRQRRAM